MFFMKKRDILTLFVFPWLIAAFVGSTGAAGGLTYGILSSNKTLSGFKIFVKIMRCAARIIIPLETAAAMILGAVSFSSRNKSQGGKRS